ncbi:MAG: pirin family protein, partial [Legionella sp.]
KGIVHSEMPSSSTGRLTGLQLWLNLPAAEKMCAPRYQDLAEHHLPVEELDSGVRVKVIAGKTDQGTQSPLKDIATKPLFLDIHLPKQAEFQQQIPQDYQTILFVFGGAVEVEGNRIEEKVLAVLGTGEQLHIKALETSQCLLVAASKLHEPIARYGPFVMNTQEEVMQALDDFRNQRF